MTVDLGGVKAGAATAAGVAGKAEHGPLQRWGACSRLMYPRLPVRNRG
ncbi:hypothetical protein [uncultured Chloroflexus sp.]|nr:hypothetical protein [uncultured Chloroflexus sp.]